jgi:hypothetical protein
MSPDLVLAALDEHRKPEQKSSPPGKVVKHEIPVE